MATAKNKTRQGTARRGRSWLTYALLALLALAGAWWFLGARITGFARLGTAYGAETACACHYIGRRSFASCKTDFEPGMEAVFLHENARQRSVTAYVPLLSSDTATYRDGFGCVLDPWQE